MGYRKNKKREKRRKTDMEDQTTEREKKKKLYQESIAANIAANDKYIPIIQQNVVMEAYYDYQGLHNTRVVAADDDGNKTFQISCANNSSSVEKQQEKELFYSTIRTILPASFRIGQDCPQEFRDAIIQDVQAHVGESIEILVPIVGASAALAEEEEEESGNDAATQQTTKVLIQPARPIPFVPNAYQLSVDRRTIRRNPRLSEFHDWLKIQTNAGFLTRQETVSMIPPVVLGVEPHHIVLDMCAAPGSKTCQMLEIVSSTIDTTTNEPRGLVIANDFDSKRAYMLVHQLRRINSPAILVTCCDGQFFPSLRDGDDNGNIFDRVLADVPCSGDGTLRKNPGIWKKWNQLGPLSLHSMQINIAFAGARLTKVGGFLCYSTCSMNPIENEAVVAELLRLSKGSLILHDKRPLMPGLVARPGWSTWNVMSAKTKKRTKGKQKPKMVSKRQQWGDSAAATDAAVHEKVNVDTNDQDVITALTGDVIQEGDEIDNDDDDDDEEIDVIANNQDINGTDHENNWEEDKLRERAIQVGLVPYDSFEDVPELQRNRVKKSCFPPTAEERSTMHLEKCMRCLPHDMDTGGFFVALLQKIAPIGSKATKKAAAAAERQTRGDAANTPNQESTTTTSSTSDLAIAKGGSGNSDFVAVDDAIWPSLSTFYGFSDDFPRDQLMARECGKSKVIYFISKVVKKLIANGIQQKTMIINSGLRAFERNSKECDVEYRVTQEGIHYIAPYMTKRFFAVNAQDFCTCMKPGGIWLGNFSTELQAELMTLSPGAFVVSLCGFERDVAKKMFLVMWRCRGEALNCLVAQMEQLGIESKLRALGLLVPISDLKPKPQLEISTTMKLDEPAEVANVDPQIE